MLASSEEECKGHLYVGAYGGSAGVAAVASILTKQKRRHIMWKRMNGIGLEWRGGAAQSFLSSSYLLASSELLTTVASRGSL
jgi:hypothetical protein